MVLRWFSINVLSLLLKVEKGGGMFWKSSLKLLNQSQPNFGGVVLYQYCAPTHQPKWSQASLEEQRTLWKIWSSSRFLSAIHILHQYCQQQYYLKVTSKSSCLKLLIKLQQTFVEWFLDCRLPNVVCSIPFWQTTTVKVAVFVVV